MRKTLLYYEQNAENFIRETRNVDFSEVQELFLSKLEKGAWFGARHEILFR